MTYPHDPLQRAWELLKADSMELANEPQLEKRLMNEMTRQTTNRPWRRKLLLAAGLLLGFMLVGSGICVAAGINPFRTFTVFMDGNNNLVVTDENGNTVSNDLVDIQTNEANGTKELTITVKGDQTKSGTTTHTTTTTTVVPK